MLDCRVTLISSVAQRQLSCFWKNNLNRFQGNCSVCVTSSSGQEVDDYLSRPFFRPEGDSKTLTGGITLEPLEGGIVAWKIYKICIL